MLNALVSGVCCIITTYFLLEYPMFTSPKYKVEQKMGKQNWENFNSFQRRIKIQGQLEEIEKKLLNNKEVYLEILKVEKEVNKNIFEIVLSLSFATSKLGLPSQSSKRLSIDLQIYLTSFS